MKTLEISNRRRGRNRAVLLASALALAAVLAVFLIPRLLSRTFAAAALPFWRINLTVQSGSLDSGTALMAENEALKRQIDGLMAGQATVAAVENENEELKSLLGRASTTPGILGAVLARPPYLPYDELLIDLGADYGLSTTSLVFAPGKILIGRVVEVLDHSSKVLLFSSPGQRSNVLIGPSHYQATAVGGGGGRYEAQLPRDSAVAAGDFVTDSGLDRPLGTVVSVGPDPAGHFEDILFASFANLSQLRWVTVKK